jgi:hypothetical protein
MDIDQAIKDGLRAAGLVRDVTKVLGPLTEGLQGLGGPLESPELRFRVPDQFMEYSAGLRVSYGIWKSEKLALPIPMPKRLHLYSLSPYAPLDDAIIMSEDKIWLDRKVLQSAGDRFKVDAEYQIDGSQALSGLVYSSAPMEVVHQGEDDEVERYWLHSELKTTKFISEIYKSIRIEGTDVAVDVTLREDIKKALSDDMRFEIMMQANLSSADRNVQAKALAYRRVHPIPKFRGNLFQLTHEVEELFQPRKFANFLETEGAFRDTRCMRGPSLADLFLPMSVPDRMTVLTTTDLTLKDPAREGKLIFKKSTLAKRLRKILAS